MHKTTDFVRALAQGLNTKTSKILRQHCVLQKDLEPWWDLVFSKISNLKNGLMAIID